MNPRKELDSALDALFFALDHEPSLDAGGAVAFLRARAHPALSRFKGRVSCEQEFKPRAAALEAQGWTVARVVEGRQFPLVMVLPERQKLLTLHDLARGWDLVEPGGALLCSLPNDWGAKRFEGHLADAAGNKQTLSKNRCRVFWARKTGPGNETLLTHWREGGSPQRILEGRFWSRPGVFCWDRVDDGSALLVRHLPENISGAVADFGTGWGFLSDHLLRHYPDITSLDVFDADASALDAAKKNLGLVPAKVRPRYHWEDLTRRLEGKTRFDFVIMNPPFHEARQPDPAIGARFIATAALALKPGGHLWLVANKHLPYERMMDEAFAEWRKVVEAQGFKILTGTKPNDPAPGR